MLVIMRKLTALITVTIVAAASCSKEFDDSRIWDKLNNHESRIEYLETLCGQMNTNIKALQTTIAALQDKDYVTNVAPITSGGKQVGYTITFLKSGSVTIYHGKDGAKGDQGEAGADGQTPIIGIKQDTDGIYYWTLNGGWLLSDGQKVKAVGTDGAKGETGAQGPQGDQGIQGETGATGPQGPQGEQGIQGEAGKDGVTPQLKIEDGKWLISYDKGVSWEEVGQATGDQGPQGETGATGPQGPQGEQGNPGVSGDSMFTDINYSNNDYVLFTLSNGQQFKIPTWSAFESLKEQCDQMNANIDALQTVVSALQNNDYVTSVTPIYEGVKEIGYIINFSKGGKATIYHGKDGEKGEQGDKGETGEKGDKGDQGEAGVDGQTPVIGIKQDTDGICYWTLNGSWLLSDGQKVKAVGTDGAKGETGAQGPQGDQGPQGEQGIQGEAGKDGVTPQLKIEDGKWLISYDKGATWEEVGQATGDQGPQGETGATGPQGPQGETGATGPQGPQGEQGIQGEPGKDGDSFFQSVTQDEENVYLTLVDGTKFSVPKTPSAAAVLTLANTTGFTATFNGTVIRSSLDLKVTVYYSTTPDLTVYKNKGKVSVTEFDGNSFTLKLTGIGAETTYYYFTEIISNGIVRYSEITSFRTGKADSYVDWEEGDHVGGEI